MTNITRKELIEEERRIKALKKKGFRWDHPKASKNLKSWLRGWRAGGKKGAKA